MNIKIITPVIGVLLLSGCAAKNIYDTMDKVDTKAAEAYSLLNERGESSVFSVSNDIWVQTKPIIEPTPNPNPKLNCNIQFGSDDVTLSQFIQRVSSQCDVAVRVSPDALSYVNSKSASASAMGGGNLPALPDLPSAPMPTSTTTNSSTDNFVTSGVSSISVNFSGKLSTLLDVYTSGMGLYWRSNPDNSVDIYYLDTRVFTLIAIANNVNYTSNVESNNTTSNGVNSGDGGVGGSGGSAQNVQQTLKYDVLANIESNLKQMVTPSVGRISMSPATGAVTVTDTPAVLRRIQAYIERENKVVGQQVKLNVEVYSVALNDSDNLSLDWDLVYKKMGSWGAALTNASKDFGGSVGSITWSGGRFDGTKLMLKALSEQGRVSTVQTGIIRTANLQPAPFQVARQTAYLASSQTTSTPDAGVTATLTPGSVTTGFSMSLLPNIIPNSKEILMQFNINLSELVGISEVKSGDSMIQTPEISSRTISQRVKLRSGESLMLSGFEESDNNASASGVGASWNPIFGGEWSRKTKRSVLVCVITPIVE